MQIPRDAPIHIQQIPCIEDKIKVTIHVVGDYEYRSTKQYARSITVKLENGHYEYRPNPRIYNVLYQQSKHDLKFIYFQKVGNDIHTYDGVNFMVLCNQDESTLKGSKHTGTIYKQSPHGDMKAHYDSYMRQIEELRQLSDNKIDVSKHGYSLKVTALNMFYCTAKSFEFEEMDETEVKYDAACAEYDQ